MINCVDFNVKLASFTEIHLLIVVSRVVKLNEM